MTTTQLNKVYIILGLILIAAVTLAPTFIRSGLPEWWPSKPIRLGLDLKGGSYLTLGVQTDEAVKSRLNAMAGSIRNELKKERLGIIRAKAAGSRTIELTLLLPPGEMANTNLTRLDQYVAEKYPALMKGKTEKSGNRAIVSYDITEPRAEEIKKNSVTQAIETIRNRVDQYGVTEPTIQRTGTDHIMVQLPEIQNIDMVKQTIGSVAKLEFRLVADENKSPDETIELKKKGGGRERLEDQVLMTGDAIDTANVDVSADTNEIQVNLRLNEEGKDTFDRITADNVGRQLAIILDDVVQSAPVIRDRISGGSAQISGNFTQEEAHRLAVVLRSGALPAPLTFEEERTVGASLGADAIKQGLQASAIAGMLIIVFMTVYYRKCGFMAAMCEALAVIFLLAILSLFGATLTLPGIAGLALTLATGVDANILVFERIREELRAGATIKAAIDAGFFRAHWAIVDSNLSTLITGLILYGWGTGPIRGFAVTLCIGVVTSVFAALYISRVGFSILSLRDAEGKLSI